MSKTSCHTYSSRRPLRPSLDRPFTRLIKELEIGESQDSPQYVKGYWKATFDTPEYREAFEPDEVHNVWWNLIVDDQYVRCANCTSGRGVLTDPTSLGAQQVLDRSFSKSFIAIKAPGEKEAHKAKVLELLGRGDSGKEWVDKVVRRFGSGSGPSPGT